MTRSSRFEKHSTSPKTARQVRGSRTGRPIMALLDLLGRRMTLRVLWELSIAERPMTFRQLQTAADTNPSVLNTRLSELREADLVVHGDGGYQLSPIGQSLVPRLLAIHKWSETWAARSQQIGRKS